MALSKEQAETLINDALDGSVGAPHAATHLKGGSDELFLTQMNAGTAGVGAEVVLLGDNDGNVDTLEIQPLFVTDILTELENEGNWTNTTYTATSGFAGQRSVSTDKHYFYECIVDNIWVRYGIALSYINAYLTNSGNDNDVRMLLENGANWTDGDYVGAAISGTFQGQAHYDAKYKYDAVDDNVWIRTPRQ